MLDFERQEKDDLQRLKRSLNDWAKTPEQKERVQRSLKKAEIISKQLIEEDKIDRNILHQPMTI